MTKRVDNPRGRPDVNSGNRWSKMDDIDLRAALTSDRDIGKAASFLCRSIEETQQRADALEIGGFRRVTKTAKTRYRPRAAPIGSMRRVKGVLRPDKVGG